MVAADYHGPPLVSFEKKIADGLGLRLGDTVTVNVLGRNITARIANLRTVDWQTLGINFVLVFSPSAFAGAPHTHIATLTYPGGGGTAQEIGLVKAVSDAFPGVTTVRRQGCARRGRRHRRQSRAGAVRGASAVTLVAAVLVLGGALAAGHRHRVYDAVILKTLGATRGRLLGAYALEYLLLGVATALFGVAAGSVAAWLVVTRVMNLTFVWLPGPAAGAAFGALLVTVAFGLVGTFTALGHKPATVLQESVAVATNRRVILCDKPSALASVAALHGLSHGIRSLHDRRAWLSVQRTAQTSTERDAASVPEPWGFRRCRTTIVIRLPRRSDRRRGRAGTVAVDEGLRAYMLRIYNYMVLGLAITGLAALGIYMLSVTTDSVARGAARCAIARWMHYHAFGKALFVSPLKWVVIFAPLALVFLLSFGIERMRPAMAQIAVLDLRRAGRRVARLDLHGVHAHLDRAGVLHHRGVVRRAVACGATPPSAT